MIQANALNSELRPKPKTFIKAVLHVHNPVLFHGGVVRIGFLTDFLNKTSSNAMGGFRGRRGSHGTPVFYWIR